jgi:hypothetical protein
MLLHIKLDRGCELPADGIEPGPGHGDAYPHLQDFLAGGATGKQADGSAGGHALEHCSPQHFVPSRFLST